MTKDKTFRDTPLWDNSLPMERRLEYLLEQLTLEEKLLCLGTGCPEIERLGIEEFYLGGEGAHGVQARHDQSFDKGEPQPTTILPNPIGMSATWDLELMNEAGRVVGNEARAVYSREKRGGLCLWAPTVDMERDPRWGRTEEAYGEDPYLAGKMASAYVQGMRGEDSFYIRCAATLKHFYANNVEDGRVWKSSSIDPRNKYEYYLEPFRRAVTEGGAEAVMSAYNEINGVPCLLNDELQHIAKEQWGLHHVVCDGGDMKQTVEFHRYFHSYTETVAAALKAGLDCFTDDIGDVVDGAREAYERGMITMEEIDRTLRCHFGTLIRLGLFDAAGENPYKEIGEEELNTVHNQRISYELAKESIVLLKNEPVSCDGDRKKPLLPLSPDGDRKKPLLPLSLDDDGQKSLAVVGPLADVWYMDWYSGIPPYYVTPLEGIRRCIRKEQSGQEEAACRNGAFRTGDSQDVAAGLSCEAGLPQVRLACGDRFLGLLGDGKTIGLVPPEQAETFEITLWDGKQATLRSVSTGMLLTTEDGRDEEDNYRQGIVTASKEEAFGWFVKEAFHITWAGDSFYEVLRGGEELFLCAWNDAPFFVDGQGRLRVAEPEGFVEEGVPESLVEEGEPEELVKEGEPESFVEEGVPEGFVEDEVLAVVTASGKRYWRLTGLRPVLVRDGIREAVLLAESSDTVIMMAGAHPMISCKEENDRQNIELPLYQRELLRAVYHVNPNIALVLVTSIPFGIAWEKEHIPAIAVMASGSMELGNALADVLFGRAAPAGRLNMTWYRDVGDLPDMDDYDIIQHGRTYQYFQGEVLYPFGHGLTYSPVSYRNLKVRLCEHIVLEVELEITNEGSRGTDEVVQIYITKKNPAVKRAIRQLKAFQRVKGLRPAESRRVCFEIPTADLQYYDVIAQKMLLEPGEYRIQAAASSQDIRLWEDVTLDGTERGVRDGLKWNPADHYDSSEHAVLWEGHKGWSCVTAGTGCVFGGEMQLAYDHVFLSGQMTDFVLDGKMTEGDIVEVYLDGILVGKYLEQQVRAGAAAEEKTVAMERTAAVERSAATERAVAMERTAAVERSAAMEGNFPPDTQARHPEADGFGEIRIQLRPAAENTQKREETVGIKGTFQLKLICRGTVKICRWRFGRCSVPDEK